MDTKFSPTGEDMDKLIKRRIINVSVVFDAFLICSSYTHN